MRRIALLVLPGLFGLAAFAAPASADIAPITTASIGTRVIVTAAVPALVPRVASAMSTVVTEVLAPGDASWSVTVEACAPNNYALPTAANCASRALINDEPGNTPGTIAAADIDISNRAVNLVDASGVPVATPAAGTETLAAARTLFTSTGQLTDGSTYDGIYTATADITLDPPGGTESGVYKGYLVVTLVQ